MIEDRGVKMLVHGPYASYGSHAHPVADIGKIVPIHCVISCDFASLTCLI